jgi:tetratricopeptide (TPR) repeat protein
VHIADDETYRQAAARAAQLIDGADPDAAVALADSCTGAEVLVDQLRGYVYTAAGGRLSRRDLLGRAVAIWTRLGPDEHPQFAYQMGNAELELWQLAVRDGDYVSALEASRAHLHAARRRFEQVGDDDHAPGALRVEALTNLANSLDGGGRDVDALNRYDQALAIDPKFGMALGNRGVTLLGLAGLTPDHRALLLAQATASLDAALADRDRILAIGGPSALAYFQDERARITVTPADADTDTRHDAGAHAGRRWQEPYLRWCLERGLFLHVSPACLREDDQRLDPLFFRGLTSGVTDTDLARVNVLVDAFNTIKQDFIAARYLTWLTDDPDSPLHEHADRQSARSTFLDSLTYARWGARTGLGVQAFAAATNVLDKIAGFTHLYLGTGRVRNVYFRSLWHPPARPGRPVNMDAELTDELRGPGNRGLLALCDLSCDLEEPTELNELVERRHTATHRFLVAHNMLLDESGPSDDWLERVEWRDLITGTVHQLGIARAALVYLARTIDIRETSAAQELHTEAGARPELPLHDAGAYEIE